MMMLRNLKKFRGIMFALIGLALMLPAVEALADYPSARRNTAMVWSEEADGAILFGGLSPADIAGLRYEFGDTWKFNGYRWVRLYPQSAPSPRYGHAMVYDSNRDRIVLFGGAAGEDFLADTWIYEDGNWTLIDTPAAPPARRFAGMAYDPIRDRVVLFGGGTGDGRFFDTWEFDGTTWTLIQSSGPQVEVPALVWDGARDEVLMLGISAGDVVMHRYADAAWTEIVPEDLPVCASQIQMVYRELDGTVMTYGGSCGGIGVSNDTMVWDGTNWTELELTRSAGSRFGYALAYDPTRHETIIYGGTGALETNSTFKYRGGTRWIFVPQNQDPGPRTQFVFQSAPGVDGIYLFAGQDAVDFFADQWRLENFLWKRVVTEDAPSFCSFPSAAVDPQREVLVVLCSDSSTWEFDGENWASKSSTDAPAPRRFSMMSWDPVSRRVLLYGGLDDFGNYLDQTWTWDGSQWRELEIRRGNKPRARMLATMFIDPATNQVIVAGGIGRPDFESDFERYEDQWRFDGSKWVEMNPTQKLPQRYGAQVAYDPQNERVLVFGGKSAEEQYLNDLWAWNGSSWSEVEDGTAPAPRMNGRMVWDAASQSMLLYGGYAGIYYSELWRYDGTWTRIEQEYEGRRRTLRPGSSPDEGALRIIEASSVAVPVSPRPTAVKEIR